MRVLSSTVDGATGADLELFYVPDGDTTIWHRVLDGDTIISDTNTGQPAPPVETFVSVADIAAQLPVATLEEANDLLTQIVDLIGGN